MFKERNLSQGHANDVFNYEAPDDTKLVTIDIDVANVHITCSRTIPRKK